MIETIGQLSLFRVEGESLADKLMERMKQGGPEPKTKLDACNGM
ncbi:MAG: hypothetical protein WC340_14035 [Kiritimatiellia bacterium]